VKVRLHGTPAEAATATDKLRAALDVVAVSRADPDRGDSHLVRVYLDVRPDPEAVPQ